MVDYSAEGTLALFAATAGTHLYVRAQASPTRRLHLYEIHAGTKAGTWDDFAANWLLRRGTAVGSGSDAVTPVALDPANGASTWTAHENYVVGTDTEPTYAATLLNITRALRLPFQWQCIAPGKELKAPSTENNGLGMSGHRSGGAFAGSGDVTFLFSE